MSIFTDADRTYLAEMRALSRDSAGREILVGLTFEETEFYMEYTNKRMQGHKDRPNSKRYLELHEKHELARLEVLGTEIFVRNENPTIQ